MKLDDKIVVITGAARGLGAAMARQLAEQGARIALIDLKSDQLFETAKSLPGGDHHAVVASVSDEQQVEAAFAEIESRLGPVDVLINNAGITRDGLLLKVKDGEVVDRMSLEQWQQVIDVNLTGVFLCGRAAAEQMIRAGRRGVIVNISSISRSGNFGQTNYTASKAGNAAMTVSWAKELARYGIRAASVSPGFTATEMVAAMPDKAIDKITSGIPLKRLAEPDEIAATVRFIIENDYVNGRDFAVDGGLRL
ncbi:SDR family oxidoreductase [Wenzhouxiangella limi]|uniref:SDR family oxidoreductase n=1 Tax=Wenzhouxiangella limi TaxID=2707351 RepID=A0A845V2D1_9GAMM|nr:SDR family oxidoreductase [Wenzhouxiangella limi]NDY94165.1 SDR family oxidoreductase [Wenzhouxiangella limi]